MATPLTYDDYVNQIATMAIIPTTDTNFQTIIPSMISYAEDRIQRDLDFLASQTSINYTFLGTGTIPIQQGNSTFTVPLSNFITIQTIEVANSFVGVYSPLLPVGKEYIQNVYGYNSATNQGTPQYFAMYGADGTSPSNYQILLGPTPDNSYDALVTGTIRFTPLSSTNSPTFISTYLPEVLIMASMIYISAYQRNFGRQSDDPAMAQSYESQYQALLKGATIEEFRKKFQSAGWTPYSPSPISSPTR
jgi:hypothetical protein